MYILFNTCNMYEVNNLHKVYKVTYEVYITY